MRVEFEDARLGDVFSEPNFRNPRFGAELVTQFRKKVGFLLSASDERDLYAYRALRFEKLAGPRAGQRSIRLNDQWRLIVRLADDEKGRFVSVVEIVDYH